MASNYSENAIHNAVERRDDGHERIARMILIRTAAAIERGVPVGEAVDAARDAVKALILRDVRVFQRFGATGDME